MEGEEEGGDITPVKEASATPSRQSSQQGVAVPVSVIALDAIDH